MKIYTITKHNFLNWYFNTGADEDQKDARTEMGRRVIERLLSGEDFFYSVYDAFDECELGCIPLMYLEEFGKDEQLGDDDTLEVMDLIFECEVTLID